MPRIFLALLSLSNLYSQIIAPDGFRGSVASGEMSATPISLSLDDAIARGLKNNIGLLLRDSDVTLARTERVRALSALLPRISGSIAEYVVQNNLTTFGIRVPGFPPVVGPFNYFDARATASVPLFDWTLIKRLKASAESERASQLSANDARDLVVAAVASGYFTILADMGRVDVTRSQFNLSKVLYGIAKDSHEAGVVPAIDELRAQVESKKQQQLLLAAENQLAKDKLALGRVIGLPGGQPYETTDQAPYAALEGLKPEELLEQAYKSRADYQSLAAQVRAGEILRKAADAQRYPVLGVDAYYGDIGPAIGNSHGVTSIATSLKFNIFDGGRIKADQEAAGSMLQHRRDELADLRGKIDFEVRDALLDLNTAADQVAVSKSSVGLATEALNQARDRYVAGVGSGIELVEAEVSLAAANQDLISASYAHNLAKVQIARAVGATEASLKRFMGEKK
jgi:outer membrane protein TolC